MRGPLRALGFADKFEEAVAQEESDPARAASAFAGIALDLVRGQVSGETGKDDGAGTTIGDGGGGG